MSARVRLRVLRKNMQRSGHVERHKVITITNVCLFCAADTNQLVGSRVVARQQPRNPPGPRTIDLPIVTPFRSWLGAYIKITP